MIAVRPIGIKYNPREDYFNFKVSLPAIPNKIIIANPRKRSF